ncbi:hypothetical protein [Streptomyces sp. A0592]|uniref:hypothetical protein n=1 Tax=Streptomyces sp. A0592 TaxID=2563099 RepID=UPI00109EBC12|nr:hypothetical protein [Streptomyces sp. A0592]THA76166.1 hypothetical protein E6U81_35880 [Streptomyces sp. A0592]
MPWAFKTIGFRGTAAGDLPLLVFAGDSSDDQAVRERLVRTGLCPLPADFEDLLRPVTGWTAVLEDGIVTVAHAGADFYRPPPGLVPEAWTRMVVATGRVVLVWLPGAEPPDGEQVLTMLRQGAGLWGTAALDGAT